MTDYSLVKNELMNIMHCDKHTLEPYEPLVNNAVLSIASLLRDAQCENDSRIVRLCAVKAYYQIILSDSDDGITSFKAGDVSYTKDLSSAERAEKMLRLAMKDCSNLIKSSSFSFRAV